MKIPDGWVESWFYRDPVELAAAEGGMANYEWVRYTRRCVKAHGYLKYYTTEGEF